MEEPASVTWIQLPPRGTMPPSRRIERLHALNHREGSGTLAEIALIGDCCLPADVSSYTAPHSSTALNAQCNLSLRSGQNWCPTGATMLYDCGARYEPMGAIYHKTTLRCSVGLTHLAACWNF